MKPARYITALIITVAFVLTLFWARNATRQVSTLERQLTDLKGDFEAQTRAYKDLQTFVEERERDNKITVDSLKRQIAGLQEELEGKMNLPLSGESAKSNRGGNRLIKRTMRVTAYDLLVESCGKLPDHPLYGITASGSPVKEWHTAAAGPELAFGTIIYIPYFLKMPNKGVFVVADRGSAITNGTLDVYMAAHEAAEAFGKQYLECYILEAEL